MRKNELTVSKPVSINLYRRVMLELPFILRVWLASDRVEGLTDVERELFRIFFLPKRMDAVAALLSIRITIKIYCYIS